MLKSLVDRDCAEVTQQNFFCAKQLHKVWMVARCLRHQDPVVPAWGNEELVGQHVILVPSPTSNTHRTLLVLKGSAGGGSSASSKAVGNASSARPVRAPCPHATHRAGPSRCHPNQTLSRL